MKSIGAMIFKISHKQPLSALRLHSRQHGQIPHPQPGGTRHMVTSKSSQIRLFFVINSLQFLCERRPSLQCVVVCSSKPLFPEYH